MSQVSGLIKRQFERRTVDVPVEFVVAPEHRDQVRFNSKSSAAAPHIVRGRAVDISSGGCGLMLSQFLPRHCAGIVRFLKPQSNVVDHRERPTSAILFEYPVRVRRVSCAGREPMYAVGVAFTDSTPGLDDSLQQLAREIGLKLDAPGGAEGGADA